MNEERRIEVETEVPVGPEEAWDAIATGPGITAWFMPAEVEGRIGGAVIHHHDADFSSEGRIIAYDPPHRFAYEEDSGEFTPPGGPPVMATEFLVEAKSGGTCVVRIVMSGLGEGDAWEQAIESVTGGWTAALTSLRLYLTHFAGQQMASINATQIVPAAPGLWDRLATVLGIPASVDIGAHLTTSGGAPTFTGRVEGVGDTMVTLLLEGPTPGIGFLGVGQPADEAFVVVRAALFGEDASDVATQDQTKWQAWLAEQFD